MSSQTKYWVFIVAVVALAVVWGLQARDTGYYVLSPTPTATQRASQGGATATPIAQTISYDAAVQQYANSRIQFDQYCQGNPSNMSLKSGNKIMLDNRSGDARTIKVDGTAYSLAGYGYQIITLSKPSSALPYTIKIDCGTAVNVAQVLLQAQISQ
ncbi:MAG: hypothetical protein Q8P35_01395 [Candidatus Yanofskybacteria bacterium]|nr:hypothetical protein [Candidatus Yanofskybacteria bacterium]